MASGKTISELAALAGARAVGDGAVVITGAASIEDAAPGDVTFVATPKYLKFLASTRASAVIIGEDSAADAGASDKNFIVAKNPHLAFAKILGAVRPQARPAPGVSPRADVHASAALGEGIHVGAYAIVEEGASIGARAVIYAGAYVGRNAEIGEDSIIYPNVSIREGCRIGRRVIIHCGAVVGSDGFGYVMDGKNRIKVPQTGIVEIGDDVEIGALAAIDRATVGKTVVSRGVKIDNLVQVAHNVSIGEDSVIVAQAGIAGSTKIGKRVILAGQAGIQDHVDVADDVVIGAKAGVAGSIKEKGMYMGYPAIPHKDWLRAQVVFAKLVELKDRLVEAEKKLEELEKNRGK